MDLFSYCCFPSTQSEKTLRQTLLNGPHTKQNPLSHQKSDKLTPKDGQSQTLAQTPLKIRLIETLGFKDFLIDNFIFARKKSTYKLQTIKNKQTFKFTKIKFTQIQGYAQQCSIIQTEKSFIPIIHFIKKQPKTHELAQEYYGNQLQNSDITLIYSHGNSSDLEYCYQLIHLMIRKYPVNYIIYDYTGYGSQCINDKKLFKQNQHKLSQQSICQDLRKVIEWSKVPYQNIILWGFSLGCYPSMKLATQIEVNNLILQSPFASIFHFIESQSHKQKVFKQDMFNNLELISKIKCNALMIHSQNDEMIPIKHSRMLLNRFNESKNENNVRLIQISNIKHNQMNFVFCFQKKNELQVLFHKYLIEATRIKNIKKNITKTQNNLRDQTKVRRDLISINIHQLQSIGMSSQSQLSQDYCNEQDFIRENKINMKDNTNKNKNNVQTRSTCENDLISNQNQTWSIQNNDKNQNSKTTTNGIELNETEFYKKSRNYSFQMQD